MWRFVFEARIELLSLSKDTRTQNSWGESRLESTGRRAPQPGSATDPRTGPARAPDDPPRRRLSLRRPAVTVGATRLRGPSEGPCHRSARGTPTRHAGCDDSQRSPRPASSGHLEETSQVNGLQITCVAGPFCTPHECDLYHESRIASGMRHSTYFCDLPVMTWENPMFRPYDFM